MQVGACVVLDPKGGNTVDVAALFRGRREKVATNGERFDDYGDDRYDGPSQFDGSAGDFARLPLGSRSGGGGGGSGGGGKRFLEDEYDTDDGFIDNEDIAVDDVDAPREEVLAVEPDFETVYEGFYVNRGDIELRKITKKKESRGGVTTKEGRGSDEDSSVEARKTVDLQRPVAARAPIAPREKSACALVESKGTPSALTNKALELDAEKFVAAEKTDGSGIKPTKSGDAPFSSGKKHKLEVKAGAGGGAPPTKRKKSSDGNGQSVARTEGELPSEVMRLVEEMRVLCVKLYGDKKPSVNKSPELQELLRKLVGAALDAGVSRLVPDCHIMALPAKLWTLLHFLRTTRSNLEGLAWALHWDAQETKAVGAIATAEQALRHIVIQDPGPAVVWSPSLKKALRSWWDSSQARVDASNQLCQPGKKQVARKRLGTLCEGLTRTVFSGYAVSKETLVEQVRLLEEEAREERREAKATKKREREEARAAAATVPGSGSAGNASGGKKSVLSQLASLVKNGSAGTASTTGGGAGGGGVVKTSSNVTGPLSGPVKANYGMDPRKDNVVAASAAAVAAAAAAARSSEPVRGRGQSLKASTGGPSKKAAPPQPNWKPPGGVAGVISGTTSACEPSSRPCVGSGVGSGSSAQKPDASLTTRPNSTGEKKNGKAIKKSKPSAACGDRVVGHASLAAGAPRPQPSSRPQDGSAALQSGSNQLAGDNAHPKSKSVPHASTDNFEVIELD